MSEQTGRERAAAIRAQILGGLDVELEHAYVSENQTTISWVAGPLITTFTVGQTSPSTPNYGVIHVQTQVTIVRNLEASRALVNSMNSFTSFNRWVLLNDPGLGGRIAEFVSDDGLTHLVRHEPGVEPSEDFVTFAAELSFVVGNELIELPIRVMALMISEQIAKASAFLGGDFNDIFGIPALLTDEPWERKDPDTWNSVVDFFDDRVIPHMDDDSTPIFNAMAQAFDSEVSYQFEAGVPAWLGSHDEGTLVCEVPYADGPFPSVIGGMHLAGDKKPERETSLIHGELIRNPQLGNGVLLFMRVPVDVVSKPNDYIARLLNEQSLSQLNASKRVDPNNKFLGFAHGIGAWVDNQNEAQYSCFVPAGWLILLTHEELVQTYRVVFENCARLSLAARYVLESDVWSIGEASPQIGFNAPMSIARGPSFGELGFGDQGKSSH